MLEISAVHRSCAAPAVSRPTELEHTEAVSLLATGERGTDRIAERRIVADVDEATVVEPVLDPVEEGRNGKAGSHTTDGNLREQRPA